ncbi:hypothetical protein OAJ67_04920 [Candidatus Nitrosopelagicus sp.]|nr:hypothetical protein [Candidatus Nitrosopelagicus sp.]
MRKFCISILILFIICLIPVTNSYSQSNDVITAPKVSVEGLKPIEKLSNPQASAYVTIRNSNGELVGISHVHAKTYLDTNILQLFLDKYETIENFSIENQNYEMKKMKITEYTQDEHCVFDREFLPCYYYAFTTGLGITGTINGEFFANYGFRGLNHSYVVEVNDTVDINWNILWPKN